MKIKSESGFSLIEGLLIVIAISLVAFVGFYVYNTGKKTDKTISTATKAASKPATLSTNKSYLEIKELGVKIPVSAQLKGLKYEVSPAESTIVGLSTSGFEKAVAECKSADTAASSFPAIATATKVSGKYDSTSQPTDVYSTFAKQFPGFYLTYGTADGGPAAYCSGNDQAKNDAVKAMFNQIVPALKQAIESAQQT